MRHIKYSLYKYKNDKYLIYFFDQLFKNKSNKSKSKNVLKMNLLL